MPRRSLVSRPTSLLTLAAFSLVLIWGLCPGSGGLARAGDARLGIEVPDRSRLEPALATVAMTHIFPRNRPSQPLPNLAQAPAVPDTEPDTAPDTAPGVGDPVPVDEPIGWFQVLWILVPLFLSLLWPLIVGGLLFWGYKYWMNKYRPKCDICGVAATVYNAKKAKPYLNQAQQIEVDLDSVFYSVAICPQCTRRKVLRFAAPNRLVTQCPRCYYKTMAITQQTTTQKPTSERDGEAIIHRTCRHCGYSATSPEVLSANTKGKSEGLDAFLDDDLGLGRLRQGYRDPREVEPRPPDDRNNGADNSL